MTINTKMKAEKLSLSMKSLSHPARVEIALLLNEDTNARFCVNEIQKRLGLSQPETSRHLAVMKHGGLVSCKKSGATSYYSLNHLNPLVNCISRCLK